MKTYRVELTGKDLERSQRGKRNRNKGRRFEQDCVNLFRAILPEGYDAWRGLQSKGGGCNPDVAIRDSQTKEQILHCELKKGKAPNPRNAFEQAFNDKQAGSIPLAITQKDRDWILVTLRWQDFADILIPYLESLRIEEE